METREVQHLADKLVDLYLYEAKQHPLLRVPIKKIPKRPQILRDEEAMPFLLIPDKPDSFHVLQEVIRSSKSAARLA
jgi:hypothetical protein